MEEITESEAISLVDKLGPHGDSDDYLETDDPIFPKTRKDICVILRTIGLDLGYKLDFGGIEYIPSDTLYLIWKDSEGLHHELLADYKEILPGVGVGSRRIKISKIVEDGEYIKIGATQKTTGLFMTTWKDYKRKKSDLGLE